MFKNFMNKRKMRRKECGCLLKYSFPGGDSNVVFGAEVKDISVNSFAIESKDEIKIGSVINGELPFSFLDSPVKFTGKVIRVQKEGNDKYIYGISFDQIDKSKLATIESYVERMDMDSLLTSAIRKGATSVHLAVGCVPACRVDGKVLHMDVVLLTKEDMERIVASIINEKQKADLYKECELDFAYTLSEENRRFRVNVFFDKGQLAFAAKLIGNEMKSFEELGLPSVLQSLINKKNGLIIVSGPVDSGKSTTLASLIENINIKRESIIISIENPIEYIYTSKNSLIRQRDVGLDTLSFSSALRSSIRQDADVVLIGEMRDLDSVSQAITAAEEGQLVLSTLHTTSTIESISRLIDIFPVVQQMQIRIQLASCLECIICQHLLPRADGKGRILASEVLMFTPAIRNLIRKGNIDQIRSYLESGSEMGMHTFDSSIIDLFKRGLITKDTAISFTSKKEAFGLL